MAYDQSKLIKEVRIYLGSITEDRLPESVITHYADMHDLNPTYTGKYPYILWKSTLSCLDYLKATTAVSSNSNKYTKKEKVGEVEVTETQDNSSSGSLLGTYEDLYDDYAAHPEKFGITLTIATSPVIIGGVYTKEVEDNRRNTDITSIYNPLSVTSFPKRNNFIN